MVTPFVCSFARYFFSSTTALREQSHDVLFVRIYTHCAHLLCVLPKFLCLAYYGVFMDTALSFNSADIGRCAIVYWRCDYQIYRQGLQGRTDFFSRLQAGNIRRVYASNAVVNQAIALIACPRTPLFVSPTRPLIGWLVGYLIDRSMFWSVYRLIKGGIVLTLIFAVCVIHKK